MAPGNNLRIRRSHTTLLIASVTILALGVLVILELTHTIHLFRTNTTKPISASQSTKGESSSTSRASNTSNSPSTKAPGQPGDTKSDSGGGTIPELLAPTGNFVSNHNPGNNGSPDSEVSVCNTTPGATCQITFTLGGTTKSLPTQVTDRGGSTYWNNWTPTSIGLASGSWEIKATATQNGQSKSTTDAIKLVVQ